MSDEPRLTDEMALANWRILGRDVDAVMNRTQDPNDFVVEPGSQLADDDAASYPYWVSSCAQACINAGVDHLHAAKTLIADLGIVHASSDYSLIRGALENFAAAFWVLHPAQRTDRIERALRWAVKNGKYEALALTEANLPNNTQVDVDQVVDLAAAAGCSTRDLRGGYSSTEALKYAEEHSEATHPFLMWQVCSGFAHGLLWANMDVNRAEVRSSSATGVTRVRFTSDLGLLLGTAQPARQLMKAVVGLHTERARALPSR